MSRDRLSGVFEMNDTTPTAQETLEAAAGTLRRLHKAGKLHPIHGWEGDVLEGYMDILGLNGRAIQLNKGSLGHYAPSSSQAM